MIHKNTFMRIAAEYGKQYPDDLRDKILGRQAIDVATIFINTLKIDLTPQQFMDKVDDMESEQLANVQLMYGKNISSKNIYNRIQHIRHIDGTTFSEG